MGLQDFLQPPPRSPPDISSHPGAAPPPPAVSPSILFLALQVSPVSPIPPKKNYPCLSLQYSEGSPFPDWSECVCVCVCARVCAFSNLGRCFSPLLIPDPHSHPSLLQTLRRGLSSLKRLGPFFSPSTLEVLIPPSSQAGKALRPLSSRVPGGEAHGPSVLQISSGVRTPTLPGRYGWLFSLGLFPLYPQCPPHLSPISSQTIK